MGEQAIVAIDQGTTNTKAVLFSTDGTVLAQRAQSVAVNHPRPGWAEQSASEIWNTVQAVLAGISADIADREVVALGISNQRETVVLWDRSTGEPVAPAISWQCRRTSNLCDQFRRQDVEFSVFARTGLVVDPLFPSTKIRWLLDSDPSLRSRAERGQLLAGTVDTWLVWKLTGGTAHATDHSNASRTQLFNLEALRWDPELLGLFGIPRGLLADIKPSDALFGHVTAEAPAFANVPIRAVLGDSHAALFGHGIREPGRAKVTCGTGSSAMTLTAHRVGSQRGISTTIAWSRGDQVSYALEGNISVSGHAAAFAAQLLGLPDEQALTELAACVDGSDGVYFVPALAGLGAPHWDDKARGLIGGMSLKTRREHVARAVLEGIAHQICDVVDSMQADLGQRLDGLSVDGGASKNDFLMRLLADFLGRPVIRPVMTEASALGAARMAGEALGVWKDGPGPDPKTFVPCTSEADRSRLREAWGDAVAQARTRRAAKS